MGRSRREQSVERVTPPVSEVQPAEGAQGKKACLHCVQKVRGYQMFCKAAL